MSPWLGVPLAFLIGTVIFFGYLYPAMKAIEVIIWRWKKWRNR